MVITIIYNHTSILVFSIETAFLDEASSILSRVLLLLNLLLILYLL